MSSKKINRGQSEPEQDLFSLGENLRIPSLPPGDFGFLSPIKVTPVFSTYWRFAAERQRIFLRRNKGQVGPWTDDAVLRVHKFTNAYRAADRVSQYLIRNVIYSGEHSPRDVVFRILLFKLFNRIDTWELIKSQFGEISFSNYDFSKYDKLLTSNIDRGTRLYSAAYIMPSGGPNSPFARKHQMHLNLLERMIKDQLPEKLVDASTMSRGFDLIRNYPTIGDFLAYQYVTDVNYSEVTDFKESDFVVPGPGARDGMKKCFSDYGGLTEPEVIKFIASRQEECFEAVGEQFPTLWGRRLQPIDCQNLFCEVDKYARVAHPDVSGLTGRTRIKQKLRPSSNPICLFFPPKWRINGLLTQEPHYVPSS